ncbi:apolipoprotein N-acyltransferase [Leptospira ryugenii]|nr:apolipoprotein N-acyltransferase [Leptospira ryugenii]
MKKLLTKLNSFPVFFYILPISLLFALSLEPYGFVSAGFLSILLLIYSIDRLTKEHTIYFILIFSLSFSLCVTLFAFPWIWNAIQNITGFSLPYCLLLFILYGLFSFYKIIFIPIGVHFLRKGRLSEVFLFLFGIPSLFLLSDSLFPMVFPVYWADLFRNHILWRQSAFFGTEAMAFLTIFAISSIYLFLLPKKVAWMRYLYILPLVLLLILNFILLLRPIDGEKSISLLLLQPNTPYAKDLDRENRDFMSHTIQNVFDLGMESIENSGNQIDLILLPESSIPFLGTKKGDDNDPMFSQTFLDIVNVWRKKSSAGVIYSELVWDQGSRNSISFLGNGAIESERAYKEILLPFGEYVPLADLFPFVQRWFGEASHHKPGNGMPVFRFSSKKGMELKFSGSICYELLYSEAMRERVARHKSQFMVNLTNDSWFESEREALQHAGAGKLRALELGIPVIRSAVSGVTVLFDPWGREIDLGLARNTRGYRAIDFFPSKQNNETFYIKYGTLPFRILSVGLLFLAALFSLKNVFIEKRV